MNHIIIEKTGYFLQHQYLSCYSLQYQSYYRWAICKIMDEFLNNPEKDYEEVITDFMTLMVVYSHAGEHHVKSVDEYIFKTGWIAANDLLRYLSEGEK